ncbi:protein phosphatase 2C domain-containing protein [Candidatus Uhrbacteria bacterium]|nr:protein phosphatase 2C domain-containing protein [Candidatus Uhrbacteria bacterium]
MPELRRQPEAPRPEGERLPEREIDTELRRAEIYELKGALFEGAAATLASRDHAERNEDSFGHYPEVDIEAVFDGVGGHLAGEVASQFARDRLLHHYEHARTLVEAMNAEGQRDAWQHVIEGNSMIGAQEIQPSASKGGASDPQLETRSEASRARLKKIREKTVQTLTEYFEDLNPPPSVKQEAAVLYLGLRNLSEEIRDEGKRRDKRGMASTATGVKLIRTPDGHRFGIFWSVGDSDAFLERAGTGEVVRAVKNDNMLDGLVERQSVTREQAEHFADDPFLRRARFNLVSQALGMEDDPTPRIMIYELEPGDRFLLATDGLGDNDLEGRFTTTLVQKQGGSWMRRAEAVTRSAVRGIAQSEGKGWDDITVVTGEVK